MNKETEEPRNYIDVNLDKMTISNLKQIRYSRKNDRFDLYTKNSSPKRAKLINCLIEKREKQPPFNFFRGRD